MWNHIIWAYFLCWADSFVLSYIVNSLIHSATFTEHLFCVLVITTKAAKMSNRVPVFRCPSLGWRLTCNQTVTGECRKRGITKDGDTSPCTASPVKKGREGTYEGVTDDRVSIFSTAFVY